MDNKVIIIINGQPTVGKDYLCKLGNDTYPSLVVSSVDKVKEAFEVLGWDGVTKTEAERLAMSDMKKISVRYNDGPTTYMISKIKEFEKSESLNILYFMIREPEEIEHALEEFAKVTDIPVTTLIIRREDMEPKRDEVGLIKDSDINDSDRNVLEYRYRYTFYNKLDDPLVKARFTDLLTHIFSDMIDCTK